MLITVLKTKTASANEFGNKSKEYIAGETVEIYDELAEVFIKQGWGRALEQKMIKEVYENKAIFNADENKDDISSPQDIENSNEEVEEQTEENNKDNKNNNFYNKFNKKRK